jgi:hypothetical protein
MVGLGVRREVPRVISPTLRAFRLALTLCGTEGTSADSGSTEAHGGR